jgi:hypothetical protein
MKTNPVIVSATVSTKQSMGRAERDFIARHDKAMKEIERWDIARELRPHTPRLANEVLRMDEAVNWEAPVIQAMCNQAGPRTGTHPMAERVEARPMATRIRPPLMDFDEPNPRIPEALAATACFAMIAGAVLIAIGLSQ